MGNYFAYDYAGPPFVLYGAGHLFALGLIGALLALLVWGWKNPQAANHLENLLPGLENPHLVVVFRDLVATMKAHIRWHRRGQIYAAQDVMLQQQRNWYLIERWKVPTAMVSYEKAILARNRFIDDLAGFLSAPVPTGQARHEFLSFLEPGSYK